MLPATPPTSRRCGRICWSADRPIRQTIPLHIRQGGIFGFPLVFSKLKEAARTGENRALWDEAASSDPDAPRTLILGEPVFAASLRWVLGDRNIRVLCPLEDPCGCLRNTDLQSWREPVIRAALAEADVIYADPLYRNLLPAGSLESTSPKEFHDVPSENYSGRMYRDRIPVFLGPSFKP